MSVTASHRDRLQAIRERTHNARGQRQRARQVLDAARAANDIEAQAVAELAFNTASAELETAEQLENMLLASMAGVNGNGHGRGDSIFNDPQTVQTLERLGNGSFPIGAIDLGPLGTVEDTVAMIESGSWKGGGRMRAQGTDVDVPDSARVGPYYGVVAQLRRRLSILDLIPTSTMIGRSFGYLQESGSWAGAREVVEGEIKPEGDITLAEAEVVASTVAVWKKMRRQELADVPSLAQTVNDRLQYACMRRLEDQVLAGDGVGENILGIVNQPGIATVAFDAAVPVSDLPLDAITAVFQNDAEPDAAVLNPVDYNAMLKATASGSGERLDSGGAFSALPTTIWSLPAIPSNAIAAGSALVGAFSTQARLFIREPINVRVSDADQDDFVRNRVTALAELRAGLAVWQPTAFCVVSLAATLPLEQQQQQRGAERGAGAKK